MAGDLEDFLKRAAERRAQKQQQAGGAARPAPKPRPQQQPRQQPQQQYTQAKRERQIRQPVQEAIPVAEVVDPNSSLAERREKARSKKRSDDARERVARQQRAIHETDGPIDRGVISVAGGTSVEQLLDLIQRPGGMQQAFILKEIFDRPEERW